MGRTCCTISRAMTQYFLSNRRFRRGNLNSLLLEILICTADLSGHSTRRMRVCHRRFRARLRSSKCPSFTCMTIRTRACRLHCSPLSVSNDSRSLKIQSGGGASWEQVGTPSAWSPQRTETAGPGSTCPGRAFVCSPSVSTILPLTMTCLMPTEYWNGSVYVDRSLTVAGSKMVTSAK